MKWISYAAPALLFTQIFLYTACIEDDDVPPEENTEESITSVTLTFTPEGGGSPVTATWVDADGPGSGAPILTDIALAASTIYRLDITLVNALDPDDPEDITAEVAAEGDEHMFFFGWTDDLFADPVGDGNIDSRADPVNYEDEDENGLPLGLATRWTTGEAASGTFRILLKHQPDIKTATSTADDGESDVNIRWDMTLQ